MTRQSIFLAINLERVYQDQKHPRFSSNPLAVMAEELGEIGTAIQNNDRENLKEEIIQLISFGVRWLEEMGKEDKLREGTK